MTKDILENKQYWGWDWGLRLKRRGIKMSNEWVEGLRWGRGKEKCEGVRSSREDQFAKY